MRFFMKTLKRMTCLFGFGLALWGPPPNLCQAADMPKEILATPEQRIANSLREFVKEPHPFGSPAQERYADQLKAKFEKMGFDVFIQRFDAQTPNPNTVGKSLPRMQNLTGRNVVATKKQNSKCGILWGGHYDTKHFTDFKFVGANDGGSSTALLLELAHNLRDFASKQETKQSPLKWKDCSQIVVLFDGEEAVLPQWNDGERLFGQRDHLYGSRHFASTLESKQRQWEFNGIPVTLVIIADMIGHKNQNISITMGSDNAAAKQIVSVKKRTKIEEKSFSLEDDHVAFAEKGIPFVHMIDWDNIQEWHTPHDTLKIVSEKKIEELVQVFLRFLNLPKN
jgi:glutaminyl-peptide cyclotransferase